MPSNMNYPGVYRKETDNSQVTSTNTGTYIATMGRGTKGIANAKVLVATAKELISTFGNPVVSGSYPLLKSVDYGLYSALEALKETSNVWYVRLTDGTEQYSNVDLSGSTTATAIYANVNATASSQYSSIGGEYAWGNTDTNIYDLRNATAPTTIRFAGIGPGKYANNYAIGVYTVACSADASTSAFFDWETAYDTTTSTTPKYPKIIKVNVYTKEDTESFNTDWWRGTSASPVETFYCSTDINMIDNFGNSLFIEDVINGVSEYVYVKSSLEDGTLPPYTSIALGLQNGADSTTLNAPIVADSVWSFFENKETSLLDVAILVPRATNLTGTNYTSLTEIAAVDSLISNRLDFVAVVQGASYSSVNYNTIKTDNTLVQGIIVDNPSYFAKYVGWTLIYDSYNSSRVYIPNSIYAGAIFARVDLQGAPWDAPAGVDRGIIPSGKQNVDVTPSLGGKLYDLNLNTIKYINGTGNVIWGQKTAQLKVTARNRLNVRRCLLYIENSVEKILNNYLFKANTTKEQEKISSVINTFMQGVLAGGGVQSYKVVCDSTNNTTSTIANNILNVDLYVQPSYTIEFIKLNTIISADTVSVTEA